jgi:O-antigen ligase
MVSSAVALVLLFVALAWTVVSRAGVWPSDWEVSLVIVGIAAVLFSLAPSKQFERIPRSTLLLFAVPVYIALTVIPLPVQVLSVLSPARAALLRNLQVVSPLIKNAPLSTNPPATFLGLFSMLAWIAVFLLVFCVTSRFKAQIWITAVPLVAIGACEAILGLYQISSHSTAVAIGTYTNRDHFAGLLEMIFPFAILLGIHLLKEKQLSRGGGSMLVLFACLLFAIGVLIFLAIAYSLSRMGFIVAISQVVLLSAAHLRRKNLSKLHWALVTGSATVIVAGCLLLAPKQLSARFANLTAHDKLTHEIRLTIWKDTVPLIAEFPLVGCGYNAYESVFMRHQTAANEYGVEFAHNDYLQLLAELGVVGFAILIASVTPIALQLVRGIRSVRCERRGFLLLACVVSLLGMAIHSFVDFNLYIPANAMTFAWTAGLGFAIAVERHSPPLSRQSP